MERNFVFIEDISIYKKVFLSLVFGIGILSLLSGGLFLGFVLSGIALNFLMQNGVELNLLDMKYRELSSWYGLRFGKWKPLPSIKYVSIFETKKRSRLRAGGGNAAHFSVVVFKLNLFYSKNKHITLLTSEDKDKVLEIGDNISKILGVKFHKALKK